MPTVLVAVSYKFLVVSKKREESLARSEAEFGEQAKKKGAQLMRPWKSQEKRGAGSRTPKTRNFTGG